MISKRALILGVGGQDGSYLAKHLLDLGYEVYGSSRDATGRNFDNLRRLGIDQNVQKLSINHVDFRSVLHGINISQPDEIYNLGGQSSVGLSFQHPVETLDSIVVGTINLLEAVKFLDPKIKLYLAGSSEVFGNVFGEPAIETSPFYPRSPYATAKAAAYWTVANYRDAYGLNACTGILFNHESPMRPRRFVTKKIVEGAVRVSQEGGKLHLGNLSIARDWGWAPDYVEAMQLMLQTPESKDYVIATGEVHSLREFCELAFHQLGLDYRDHVIEDPKISRPSDIVRSVGNPIKAYKELGWSPSKKLHEVVSLMIDFELRNN